MGPTNVIMSETNSSSADDYTGLLDSPSGFVGAFVPATPHSSITPRLRGDGDDLNKLPDHFEITEKEDGGDDRRGEAEELFSNENGIRQGTATPAQVSVNIFISFVGVGLLGLPYAFSRSGYVAGIVALTLVSAGNVYAMLLLVKCRKRLEAREHFGIKGYGDLGREVLGPRGEVLVNVCLVVSQAGFATAYLIFIAANIHEITEGRAGRALIIYGCVPILSVLVQFRDMKTLSPFSLVADVANLMGLSCVIFQDFEYNTHSDNIKTVDFEGLIYVTSICIYSLEGVGLILPLESSCANREEFPRLLKKVILGITLLMGFFGTCGYVAFGDETKSPISRESRFLTLT